MKRPEFLEIAREVHMHRVPILVTVRECRHVCI